MNESVTTAHAEAGFKLSDIYDLDLPVCDESFRRVPCVSWQFMIDECEVTLPFLNRQRRSLPAENFTPVAVEFVM